ncbi:MAG: DUF1858 domain-containing protein [Tannerella sp.]|jgi:hypothetical protein|nr:DUF1858 domain-containing protein [Tannerella sp.]
MASIDPKMTVAEILKQYPETVSVFQSFHMKCAEDKDYADKSLEENMSLEKVNFMDVFLLHDKKR